MMRFRENVDLRMANTLRLPMKARFWAEVQSETELAALMNSVTLKRLPSLVLGGGSNVILSQDFSGVVIHPAMRGLHILEQSRDQVVLEAAAGESWHSVVEYTLRQGWSGLENLALIPGSVGAAPVQNIGAYGVELEDVMHSLVAVERSTGKTRVFMPEECGFAYRESIFKSAECDRWIITAVRFTLHRQGPLHLDYGDIRSELQAMRVVRPTSLAVARAVMAIRRRKLPDPALLPNAGSFFKNPVISQDQYRMLQQRFPDLIAYPFGHEIKLAAGWLIDQCGFRGRRQGAVACHERQALVLLNHGNGTAEELLAFANDIVQSVRQHFGVTLEMEPRIY